MSDRDDLAAFIQPFLRTSDDEGWTVDTLAEARDIAAAIIAAGWRALHDPARFDCPDPATVTYIPACAKCGRDVHLTDDDDGTFEHV